MSEVIRIDDRQMLSILKNELQEYVPVPIPEQNLENILYALVAYLRNTSRSDKGIVKINSVAFWNKKEENLIFKDKVIEFTYQERKVLSLLFKNLNSKVSYEMIAIELWGETVFGSRERIKTIIKQIRKKLPENIIKNIFSFGYKIELIS